MTRWCRDPAHEDDVVTRVFAVRCVFAAIVGTALGTATGLLVASLL